MFILSHANNYEKINLRFILKQYEKYYNEARPHQGINQFIPNNPLPSTLKGTIKKRSYLGGLLNDYYREAANYNWK